MNRIFESPDNIKFNGDYVGFDFNTSETKPFAFHINTGEIWIGEFRQSHGRNCPFLRRNGGDISYDDLIDDGRLWYGYYDDNEEYHEIKMISFWKMPVKERLIEILNILSDKLNISFEDWLLDTGSGYSNQTSIPISSIENIKLKKLNLTNQKIDHLLSTEEKERMRKSGELNVPKGFGSTKKFKYQSDGMELLKYKNILKNKFTESKNMKHLMSYQIFESKYQDFFIINSNNIKESYEIQRELFKKDYGWPTGSFIISEDKIYLCVFPHNKKLAYLNKKYSTKDELEKEKNNALFYVDGFDFIQNPEKYLNY
jgi:hypothetical protein